jgi:hypothetical protein
MKVNVYSALFILKSHCADDSDVAFPYKYFQYDFLPQPLCDLFALKCSQFYFIFRICLS